MSDDARKYYRGRNSGRFWGNLIALVLMAPFILALGTCVWVFTP